MKLADKFLSLFKRDVILFFTTLLTGIVIARELGPKMMGVWTILLLIPGYAEAFGRLQFDVSAVYFIGKKKADIGKVTFILHLVAMISAFTIFCFFLVGYEWFYQKLFANVDTNCRALAFVVFIIYPLRLIYLNYSYLLISCEDIKTYNNTLIIQAVLTCIISIVLIINLHMGINGALLGSVVGLLVAIIYAAIKVQRISVLKINFDFCLFLEMSKYAVHYYFSGLIGYFQNNITSLIAAGFVGPAQVVFFVLGKATCEVSTRMVPVAVNTALFPYVSRLDDDHESSLLVARLFRVTLLILFFSSLC
ncbi:oligosaccharide flippase family protein, partial [Alphaproteobacteria bacterium]|nr:oligosaccharide flippase family protein [Alphaproteobacteria bacterium]